MEIPRIFQDAVPQNGALAEFALEGCKFATESHEN